MIFDEYSSSLNTNDGKKYKNLLQNEIDQLILNEWSFLNENWKKKQNNYKHRTELKYIKDIQNIKKELLNKLGYTSVFFFLTKLFTNKDYPSPYFEIEKGLYLIYHLISGVTSKDMKRNLPYSSFYKYYKEFWITNYENLNKYADLCLKNMFSNIKIRVYSALIKNPQNFKNITLMLDGHDSTIEYDKPDISTQKRWSYKLKAAGIRTQVLTDINNFIVHVSDSQLCGVSSDGGMFLNMKLYNKMDKRDVMAIDGGYTLFINQFEKLCENKNIKLNDNNFFYPIRKEPNEELNREEKHFNDVFGSFRSSIENIFGELGNTFKRFSNNNSTLKTDDIKYINLQLKIAFLLKNIKLFTETFNIITQDHHKLWFSQNFEFPTDEKLIDIVLNNQIKQMGKIKIMTQLQSDFEDLNLDNSMIIDDEEDNENINNNEDVDFPEYNNMNKKKRKKGKSKRKINLSLIRDINKNNNFYEIENIIQHNLNKEGNYEFLVKWKDYDISENSWVNENDFNEKNIIRDYFNKQKIKY
jgi:hypothetical protein